MPRAKLHRAFFSCPRRSPGRPCLGCGCGAAGIEGLRPAGKKQHMMVYCLFVWSHLPILTNLYIKCGTNKILHTRAKLPCRAVSGYQQHE